jgi:hypothetical protein
MRGYQLRALLSAIGFQAFVGCGSAAGPLTQAAERPEGLASVEVTSASGSVIGSTANLELKFEIVNRSLGSISHLKCTAVTDVLQESGNTLTTVWQPGCLVVFPPQRTVIPPGGAVEESLLIGKFSLNPGAEGWPFTGTAGRYRPRLALYVGEGDLILNTTDRTSKEFVFEPRLNWRAAGHGVALFSRAHGTRPHS